MTGSEPGAVVDPDVVVEPGVVVVRAPLAGRVVALAEVPDAVFAQEMVGPGVAVDPRHEGLRVDDPGDGSDAGTVCEVVAPVAGVVGSLFPHAFAIETPDGATVLVHLGIDTVRLEGAGFDLRVRAGGAVVAGQVLVVWRPAVVAARGLATVCPVVALQADPASVTLLAPLGSDVSAGQPLLSWRTPPRPA